MTRKILYFLWLCLCLTSTAHGASGASPPTKTADFFITYKGEANELYLTHITKRNENLTKLSIRYGLTVSEIMSANKDIKKADVILIGQHIRINLDAPSIASLLLQPIKKTRPNIVKKGRDTSPHNTAVAQDATPLPYKTIAIKAKGRIINVRQYSREEKIQILEEIGKEHNIPWQRLAGLSTIESRFGKYLIGGDGVSYGPFQTNLSAHTKMTLEQAMDWREGAKFAARYLNELGYQTNPLLALRHYNSGPNVEKEIPSTLNFALAVIEIAEKEFDYCISVI